MHHHTTGDFVTIRRTFATLVLAGTVLGGGFMAMGSGSAGAAEVPTIAVAATIDTAQAGDLVYYPGHVMMWLGVDNLIVHAPQRGRDVEVGHVTARRIKRMKFANPIG